MLTPTHPPPPEMTRGFLLQLIFSKTYVVSSGHQSVTPFLSGAPPPKKENPGSTPAQPAAGIRNALEQKKVITKKEFNSQRIDLVYQHVMFHCLGTPISLP